MHVKRPGAFRAQLTSWVTVLALSLGAVNARLLRGSKAATDTKIKSDESDDAFLEGLSRRSFQFFWDASDPNTGITREHLYWNGSPYPIEKRDVGSTGATGFGITALCIAADRDWIPREKARQRALNIVHYYAERAPNEHGWFYHWLNVINGQRTGANFDSATLPLPKAFTGAGPKSEVSVSDSTWLIAGALTAAECFPEEPQISRLAKKIYERVDYAWMRNGDPYTLSHGWLPETGFIKSRYDKYCQLALMYLLGIGSPTHPLPAESWYAWERTPNSYGGYQYIGTSLLWTYQYPFAWADFRSRREKRAPHTDWWANAATATRAHRVFCIDLAKEFPGYSQDIWGITSSMSKSGYKAWGGPPRRSSIDGSVVPSAAAGSLMLTPDISLPALRAMKQRYGDKIWTKYGFADSFDPTTGWVCPEVIGLDEGITLLSGENLRSGKVWHWFMRNREIVHAMELAPWRKLIELAVSSADEMKGVRDIRTRGGVWAHSFVCAAALVIRRIAADRVALHVLYGWLLGKVTDASGAAVPRAAVKINQLGVNESRQTQTNDLGAYSFPTLLLVATLFFTWAAENGGSLLRAVSLRKATQVEISSPQATTFCNPLNIDYTYQITQSDEDISYRSGADPAVVNFRGGYYMFVTRSMGYWYSKDLTQWSFITPQRWYFQGSNAPAAHNYRDELLYVAGDPSGTMSLLYTDDPQKGDWQAIPALLRQLQDPDFFIDDDGRAFMFWGSSNRFPIRGYELDPHHRFLPKTKPMELFNLDEARHGWERFGENHDDPAHHGFIEGAWLTKHDGKYYMQYASPGTQWNTYGDGVYIGSSPMGPYAYAPNSPISYKPGGFINGAGHGSTVIGPGGQYWHFATMAISVNHAYERRLAMFPTFFDREGLMYSDTEFGDYPHYAPSVPERKGAFTGWMLLSYKKPVRASSHLENFTPDRVADESVKTFWVAQDNGPGQWLEIDLETAATIRAFQLNYHDYKSDIYGRQKGLYHQYIVDSSLDRKKWTTLKDRSRDRIDTPNDYFELPHAVEGRFVRFRSVHVPTPYLAISGFRIFGNVAGNRPAAVTGVTVVREQDRRNARVTWDVQPESQGYHVRWGIAPDKLYSSWLVYGQNSLSIRSLNADQRYYFAVEAFDVHGVGPQSAIIDGH